MNRHERRARQAAGKSAAKREASIRATLDYLANVAGPTATGATLFLPNGEVLYLDATTARELAGKPAGGRQ